MDLIGQKFNKLLIIGESKTDKKKVICQCDCGTIKEINKYNLKSGQVQSCGCLHKEKISKDLKDKRFGKLIVLEKTIKRTKDRNIIWKCQCDCGNLCEVSTNNLIQGYTKSCGCLVKETMNNQSYALKDISGQRFGKLVALKPTNQRNKQGHVIWECKCDCGNITYADGVYLRQGDILSCGCLKSIGEEKISKLLQQNNIYFEKEKTFGINSKGGYYRFDFYVNNKYLIEYDGIQHFKESNPWNCKARDIEKNIWCKDNNIPLIRIPYTQLNKLCLEDLLLETSNFIVFF